MLAAASQDRSTTAWASKVVHEDIAPEAEEESDAVFVIQQRGEGVARHRS